MFESSHWEELTRQGYTAISGLIGSRLLQAAQAAARRLNDVHPDGGWELGKGELWREVRYCRDADFMAIASAAFDPLALEILETAPPIGFVQLASTLPGFTARGGIGRNFHIDGGKEHGVFNVLLGVALTDVASDTAGGFHVLPGSHELFAREFRRQHWGNIKRDTLLRLQSGSRLVVPRLAAGDIIVAHSFLVHGTSANTSTVRRDMIFQRRATAPLCDPDTRAEAQMQFMRDSWALFRRPATLRSEIAPCPSTRAM